MDERQFSVSEWGGGKAAMARAETKGMHAGVQEYRFYCRKHTQLPLARKSTYYRFTWPMPWLLLLSLKKIHWVFFPTFWEKVHLHPPVICHVSQVMWHLIFWIKCCSLLLKGTLLSTGPWPNLVHYVFQVSFYSTGLLADWVAKLWNGCVWLCVLVRDHIP